MMERFGKLSLRYKLPIAFGSTIAITALIISGVLSWYTYHQMRDDLVASAEGISRTLAKGLAPMMLRDEVWQAFETVITPLILAPDEKPGSRLVIVLDKEQRIFVSSTPRAFGMQQRLLDIDKSYAPVLARLNGGRNGVWYQTTGPLASHIFVATPIQTEDGLHIGTVIVRYADTLFLDRFAKARDRVMLATLLTILILLPLAWLFSKRLADPLVALRRRMADLPGQVPIGSRDSRQITSDEIQELAAQFEKMQQELQHNEVLKTRIASADRLAAIGRLAAGIAHEINNPLGGMINAVNTFERFGGGNEFATKTTSLLKRGLAQIKHTVGAMLVEARLESRFFTSDDVEDLRTLALGDQSNKAVQILWTSTISEPVALPATPVRQLILNLVLNAKAASQEHGAVYCDLVTGDQAFFIRVTNTGRMISPERMEKLFEPYDTVDSSGNGLGLWICYQIVTQLNGVIDVSSTEGVTVFTVTLPITRIEFGREAA